MTKRVLPYIFAGAALVAAASPSLAQSQRVPVQPQAAPAVVEISSQDARQTREEWRSVLGMHPPALARVFKLDPSLMTNEAYLAAYPGVAAFLKQHPEIARDPGYFLDWVNVLQGEYRAERESVRMWSNFMEGLMVAFVMSIVGGFLVWLVKTVIDHRRWLRLTKTQTDVHSKLFDRLSSNEDLLAYIQTSSGRRFLEGAGASPAIQAQARPLGVPVARILWAVQVGIIILAGALGVLVVSGRVIEEVAQPLFAIATIGISLGVGFIVSSAVAYVISRSMGLIETPPPAGPGPDAHL